MKNPDEPKEKAYHDLVVKGLNEPGRYSAGSVKDPDRYPGSVSGLYLQVTTTAKLWRFKYKIGGKANIYSIGKYPEVTCAEARRVAKWALEQVDNGVHPLQAKKNEQRVKVDVQQAEVEAQKQKEANTFRKVAERWLEFRSNLAPKTLAGHQGALKNHVFPWVGDVPVADIKLSHIISVMDRLVAYPTVARRALDLMKMVLGYAEDRELIGGNVAKGRSGLLKKHKTKHHPALTDKAGLAEFLRRLDALEESTDSVTSALRLLVLLPVRPSELATAKWEDVHLDSAEWRYTMSKTKEPHIVALPTQAVALLRARLDEQKAKTTKLGVPQQTETSPTGWVFPSASRFGRPISGDTILVRIIDALGYKRGEVSAHGFRSSFRTIGHEVLDIDPIVLELSLGHRMPGALGATYARGLLLKQRHAAAQKYADYLDGLRASATGQ